MLLGVCLVSLAHNIRLAANSGSVGETYQARTATGGIVLAHPPTAQIRHDKRIAMSNKTNGLAQYNVFCPESQQFLFNEEESIHTTMF